MTHEEKLKTMDALMRKGILSETVSGKPYFTGYAYESLYDWDQYFESLVQLYLVWGTRYPISGVEIFLDNQQEDGFIPRAIDPPELRKVRDNEASEMVKPFLCQILCLALNEDKSLPFLEEHAERVIKLKKYLSYWLFNMDKRGAGLSIWCSAPHSGMDNQMERCGGWGSRFCEGIDLNSFLCREIKAYGKLCRHLHLDREAAESEKWFEQRKNAILSQCWNEEDGMFYDVDARTGRQMNVKSVAAFAPFWAGIASREQAERAFKEHLLNPDEFWRKWPVPAYAAGWSGYEKMFMPGDLGCCWRCNTWIPTNYYVFQGLRRYGFDKEAKFLADKTYELVDKEGFREYYGTEEGVGCGLDPFWGWSLLAVFMPQEYETGCDPTLL